MLDLRSFANSAINKIFGPWTVAQYVLAEQRGLNSISGRDCSRNLECPMIIVGQCRLPLCIFGGGSEGVRLQVAQESMKHRQTSTCSRCRAEDRHTLQLGRCWLCSV